MYPGNNIRMHHQSGVKLAKDDDIELKSYLFYYNTQKIPLQRIVVRPVVIMWDVNRNLNKSTILMMDMQNPKKVIRIKAPVMDLSMEKVRQATQVAWPVPVPLHLINCP